MTHLGICTYPLIPLRDLPSEAAEQTTQLIFGEAYEILETIDRWTRIRTLFDDYLGWVDFKLPHALPHDFMSQWLNASPSISTKPISHILRQGDPRPMPITGGSEFRLTTDNSFLIGDTTFSLTHDTLSPTLPTDPVDAALQFFGSPYLWGGRSIFGIDCSGLTQIAHKICGLHIPRDASQQVLLGHEVSLNQAARNDLAFFQKDDGRICHVGLYMGDNHILHSSGSVRIDTLDSYGIYNNERQTYTHKLLCLKHLD